MIPKRALGYVRVSTAVQAEQGYSIPEQERAIRAYCAQRGYQITGLVFDAGESGKLEDRPGLIEVLERADGGDYDVLVPVCIDRFGRNSRLILNTTFDIQARGIIIDYVEDGIAENEDDQFIHEIKGSVAGLEWAKIRKRMMMGRLGKAKQGRMPQKYEPFGYRQISPSQAQVLPEYRGRSGELLIVEEEAELVREMFRRAAEGDRPRTITRWLNESGHFNRNGRPWEHSTVRRILIRPTYKGTCLYNRVEHRLAGTRTKSGAQRQIERPRDPSKWITIPCPAIVDEATWEQVQRFLEGRYKSRVGRPSHNWPLRGVVYCAHCLGADGRPMRCRGQRITRNRKHDSYIHRYYECQSVTYTTRDYCGTKNYAATVEEQALDFLQRISAPGVMAEMERQRVAAAQSSTREADLSVERWEKRVAELNAQLSRLADDLIRAGFPSDIIREKVGALSNEREEAQRQLHHAQEQRDQAPRLDETLARAEIRAAEIRAALAVANGDVFQLQETFQAVLRIWIDRDKQVRIELQG